MKRNLFLKLALLSFAAVLIAGSVGAVGRAPSYFNYPWLKPVSEVQRGQEAEFELTFSFIKWLDTSVTPRSFETMKYIILADTTDITMRVTVSVLNYERTLSTETITIEPDDDSTYALRFSVLIPDQDTLKVVTDLNQSGFKEQTARYFVWNGDEMEPRRRNPRGGPDKPNYGRGFPIPDPRVQQDPAYPHGRPFPDDGSVVSSSLTSEQRDSLQIAKMRELERTPLTDSVWERITVGGVKWSRRQGDSLFREPLYYDKLHDSAVRAKMAAFDARTEHEICLDLSDTADYRMVTSMLGAGSPSSKPGFLIFTATRDQINELSSLGFGIMYLEHNPSMRPDASESNAVPDAKPSSGESGLLEEGEGKLSRAYVFQEDFGAGWYGRWNRDDELSHCGYDMWGPSSTISNAAWCAKNGDMIEGYHYDCLAWATLTSTMINTEGYYADLSIDFEISYDLETVEGDYLTAKYSYNGNYWWFIDGWTGSNAGFEDITFDVPNNPGTLYLRFLFHSKDNAQGVTRDGAWIRNISVSGTEIVFPNFTWYPIPGTWDDGPLVISQSTGTTTDTDVYAGETCYLDWAVTNDGDISWNSVPVHLLVDDVEEHSWYVATAEVGVHYGSMDYPLDLSEGLHKIEMVIDQDNLISELDENDNTEIRWITVKPAQITYTGILEYSDLSSPPAVITRPMRGVKIEMVDSDYLSHDVLDSCRTNDTGYFSLGPVANDNDITKDGKSFLNQDIFFRIYADNEAAYVTDSHEGDRRYTPSLDTITDHPSGVFQYNYTADSSIEESGAFFVVDALLDAKTTWDSLMSSGGWGGPLAQIEVVMDGQTIGSKCWDYMTIQDAPDSGGYSVDVFDRSVIYHEYGHFIENYYNVMDSFTTAYTHDWYTWLDPHQAAGEGLAHFISCYLRNDSATYDWNSGLVHVSSNNLENGNHYYDGVPNSEWGTITGCGYEMEGAVAGMFWDIYDDNDGLEDFSTYGDCLDDNVTPQGDGFGDSLYGGIEPIMDALFTELYPGTDSAHRPDFMDEFWQVWFHGVGDLNLHSRAMVDIWYEHGVPDTLDCCVGIRGDINGDGTADPDIADLSYLVAFMFQEGPPPPCYASPPRGFVEADVDADGTYNGDPEIGDLIYLVSYMFHEGSDLQPCLQYDQ